MAAGKDSIRDATSRMLAAERFGFELFTIHPDLKCKPYRYTWGTSCQVSAAGNFLLLFLLRCYCSC